MRSRWKRPATRRLLRERNEVRAAGREFGIGMAVAVETSASNMAYVNLALTHAQRLKSLPNRAPMHAPVSSWTRSAR